MAHQKEQEEVISFKGTLKELEKFYRDFARFDGSYVELKETCREAFKDESFIKIFFSLKDVQEDRRKLSFW